MKYVSIEGSSYAGKTTVIKQLGLRGFETIPEYDEFGPFMPNDGTIQTSRVIAQDFIEREIKRTALLEKMSGDIVFGDRSPLSLITFEDMLNYLQTGLQPSDNASRSYIIELLDNEIKKGTIIFPDALIVMRVDSDGAFKERVAARGVTAIEALSSFAVQQLIGEKALSYGAQTLGPESVASIDTSWKSPYDVTNETLSAALKLPASTQLMNMADLL